MATRCDEVRCADSTQAESTDLWILAISVLHTRAVSQGTFSCAQAASAAGTILIGDTPCLSDHLDRSTARITIRAVDVFVASWSTVALALDHIIEEADGISWTWRRLTTGLTQNTLHVVRHTLTLRRTNLTVVTVACIRWVIWAAAAVAGGTRAFKTDVT